MVIMLSETDLRGIIHDVLGDTPRVEVETGPDGVPEFVSARPSRNGVDGGEAVEAHEFNKLEDRLMVAIKAG